MPRITKVVSISLPPSTLRKLKQAARADGRNASQYVDTLIRKDSTTRTTMPTNMRRELTSHGDIPSNAEPTPTKRKGCNFVNELTTLGGRAAPSVPDPAPTLRKAVR
jgi:hypothetical protein